MAKSKSNSRSRAWEFAGSWLAVVLQPGVAMPLAVVVIAVIGLVVGWRSLGPMILADHRHQITEELVDVTPQPSWIRANVKAEVLQANDLLGKSALDPQITVAMARAFGVHSWVAQVKRVRKSYPAKLTVELDYRRPVGMVMVRRDDGGSGVIPIDERAVVLPTEDFMQEDGSASMINDYLRINVGETRHHGPTGTAWGDERVAAAARLASFLSDIGRETGIQRIELSEDSTGRRAEDLLFDLVGRDDCRFVWGHIPECEASQELPADEKRELLKQLASSASADARRFDLRSRSGQTPVHVPSVGPGNASPPHSARSGTRVIDQSR